DLVAVVDGDHRAVGNLVTLSFAAVEIGNRQLAGAGHRYLIVFPLHQLDVDEAHGTGGLDLDIVHRGSPRRRATDVEGAHGELGAGLADGLGGDNTHRLPLVDLVAPGQIAAVALGTDAETGFTGNGRAHQPPDELPALG